MLKKKIFWILILGFALRLIVIDQSLWLDESIGAWAVKNFSYQEVLNNFLLSDNHPPLYYLLLKFWTAVFGFSEISLRMPSVIFGVGTIYYTFLIAKSLFGKQDGNSFFYYPLIASLFLATSPLHVYYSQEARMYSMAAFFAAASIYFFINTLKSEDTKTWISYSISQVGMVFSDYMPIFLLPVFWLIAYNMRRKRIWIKRFLTSQIPLLILGFLWAPTFFEQSAKGKWLLQTLPAWKSVAGGASIKQAVLVGMKFVLGRISFSPKPMYYVLVLLASVPFFILFTKAVRIKKSNKETIVILWLFVPLVFGFVASFLFPAFIYFRYIYILPAFYLTSIIGLSRIKKQAVTKTLIALILSVNVLGLSIYFFDKDQHREDWRAAAFFINKRAGDHDVVLFEYPQPFTPYRWYSKNNDISFGATDSISADPKTTQQITGDLIEGKDRIFHFDYLKDLSDPQDIVEQTIKESGYAETEVHQFRGIGQVEIWEK